jgi:hypothetical protein
LAGREFMLRIRILKYNGVAGVGAKFVAIPGGIMDSKMIFKMIKIAQKILNH